MVTLTAAVIVGLLSGRSFAYMSSIGGFSAALGVPLLGMALVGGVVGVAVVAAILARLRGTSIGSTLRFVALATGVLALAAMIGAVTARATGAIYVEPIVLQAGGRIHVDVTSEGMPFVVRADAAAECASVPDGRLVGSITALDVGELGDGTLRGSIGLGTEPGQSRIEFFIDGADLPEGDLPPVWGGTVPIDEVTSDRSAGRASFDNLRLLDEGKDPDATVPPSEWPESLSGTISWTCDPW